MCAGSRGEAGEGVCVKGGGRGRQRFFKRIDLFIFREREREGEREGNLNVQLPPTCPIVGTWPTTQAMCPDWESNRQPFGLQACAQPTELHQPGQKSDFFKELVHVNIEL